MSLRRRFGGAILVLEMRNSIDVLAEGILLKNSRGDKTAIDLFQGEIAQWESRKWHIVSIATHYRQHN